MAHIDAILHVLGTREWHFTGFYGHPETAKRCDSWTLLKRLKRYDDMPWLVAGDFHEILKSTEKSGRLERHWYQMETFRQALSDCTLQDMGFQGNKYTWWNGRYGADCVYERLDRGVCTAEWKILFPFSQVRHVPFSNSDHDALIVAIKKSEPQVVRRPRMFRFENNWVHIDGCEKIVHDAWFLPQTGHLLFQVCQRIKACRMALLQWSHTIKRPTQKRVTQLRTICADLEQKCQNNPGDVVTIRNRSTARKNLNDLLAQEECYWHQRSRVSWLRDGDRNTGFFHASATQRHQKNKISGLRNAAGLLENTQADMSRIVESYFSDIFHTSHPQTIDQVVNNVESLITPAMNASLLQSYTSAEIREALFQMNPTKAPGPDGMNALFYQKFWHIIGNDVTSAILDFLQSGQMLKSINYTHIALIPKILAPDSMTHFRPISLCNVLYKIISKVLANRLKPILNHVISGSQSAFVPGRLITDNILVAFEALHYLKTKRKGRSTHMAVKLDMSKAYDRVE